MTREEMKQRVQELLTLATPENQARASELLTEVSDGFETVLSASETANNRVAELTANNERLRDVNTKLFLKVGAPSKEKDNDTPPAEETEINVTVESLFNEKGELL